jgi:hypothetical protein
MVKNRYLLVAVLIVLGLLLGAVQAGSAQPPPMPSSFYGTVKADGSNVSPLTLVSAWINGVKYAESQVMIFNTDTVYALDVPGDIVGTPEIEGGKPGDVITFRIGNTPAHQTGTWQSGTNVEFNLSVGSLEWDFELTLPIIIR